MDLSTLYDHEQLFPLDIVDPVTGKPVGLRIQLRSAESRHSEAIARRHADENLTLQRDGRPLDTATVERQILETTAALVADWDWQGDATWKGEKPECSRDKVMEVLQASSFIFKQVRLEAGKLENFTGHCKTPSAGALPGMCDTVSATKPAKPGPNETPDSASPSPIPLRSAAGSTS